MVSDKYATDFLNERKTITVIGVDGSEIGRATMRRGDVNNFLECAYQDGRTFIRLSHLDFGGTVDRHIAMHRIAEIQVEL